MSSPDHASSSSSSSSSSENLNHETSGKHRDYRLLTQISSSSTSSNSPTIYPQSADSSGPLTPDISNCLNPFSALATINVPSSSSVRIIGEYELSETKFDDFKCARHIPTGETVLYKEFSLETIRQKLEPYQRIIKILQLTNKNTQLTAEQLAHKYHIHFFRDIVTFEQTAIVLYSNYSTNLHQYITEKHRLNENESRNLFSQIVRAVQICHRVGLIVRDLKLRKIIFGDNSNTSLLITGIDESIILSNPTTTDDLVSSRFSCPVYACPEIVLNRQMYSGKMADSWSLGIILYTMLFGRYPFCDRTLVGLFIKIGRCRPDIPRTISLKARSLLRSLIRVKPEERLLTQDILGHVWFGGDKGGSTIMMNISTTSLSTNEEHMVLNNNINCTNNHNANDIITKEDAVVPNYECE